MTNNNKSKSVSLSQQKHIHSIDEINDAKLLTVANERMSHYDPAKVISSEEMDKRLHITEADLEGYEDVEFE